jgi:hypothetical protein
MAMSDKVYEIEGSTMSYDFGFEGDIIYCHLIRRIKECRLDQITKVVQKKPSIGLGEEISFRIYFTENGKEKKFPWVQGLIMNPSTKEFLEDLKSRLPVHVAWEDQRAAADQTEAGQAVYDLQYLPFGYAGAGLSRSLQIWIYLICLAVLVIPLIYNIYLLTSGGYRIYVGDKSLTIRKAGKTVIPFDDIEKVDMQQIEVRSANYSSSQLMKIWFQQKSGKRKKVIMRYDQCSAMFKDLGAKGVMSEEEVHFMA